MDYTFPVLFSSGAFYNEAAMFMGHRINIT